MPQGIGQLLELTPAEKKHCQEKGLVARWARVHGSPTDEMRAGLYRNIGYEPLPEGLRRRVGNSELYVTTKKNADQRADQKEKTNQEKMSRWRRKSATMIDEAASKTRHMRPIGKIDDVDFSKRQRYGGRGKKVAPPQEDKAWQRSPENNSAG